MSMLERYRKPGGFLQLLSLIETCTPSKQEKLLETVAREDGAWADAIRSKMLNIDRIFSWNDDALLEIFGTLQDLTVAVAILAADEQLKPRLTGLLTLGRRRKIEDLFGSTPPSAAEISATHVKIVESVRKMGTDGFLRFEKVDPDLVIDEDIDDRLAHPSGPAPTIDSNSSGSAHRVLHAYSPLSAHQSAAPQSAKAPEAKTSEVSESRTLEMQALKKRVADLSKENAVLRHELSMARSKLDQIKKIA